MLPVLKLCIFLFLLLKGEDLVELSYITEYEPFNVTFHADENFKPTALAAFSNGKLCDAQFASDLQYYSITISKCQGEKILIYLVDTVLKKGVYSMLSVHERKKSNLEWFINGFLRRKRQSLSEQSPEVNKTQQIIGGRKSGTAAVEVVETTAIFNVQFNGLEELTYFCDMDNDVLMVLNPDVMVYKSVSAYNSATKIFCPATLSQNRVVVSIFNCSLTTEVHLSFTSIDFADGIIGGKRFKIYAINCLESQSNFTSDKLHTQSHFSTENAMFIGLADNDFQSVPATGFKFKWSDMVIIIPSIAIWMLNSFFN